MRVEKCHLSPCAVYLLDEYSNIKKENVKILATDIASMLNAGDINGAMEKMKGFFANIPYDIQIANEKYYQKYLGAAREIILIGAKFSTKKHNMAD